jgi:hypothetical protein
MDMRRMLVQLACVSVLGCASAAATMEQTSAKDALATLNRELANGKVRYIRIEGIPFAASFDPEITETLLDSYATYRCDVDVGQMEYDNIVRLVGDTHVTGEHVSPYIRWGIIFYDSNHAPLSAIYTGEYFAQRSFLDAKIDGYAATIDKPLIEWIVSNVPFNGCVKAPIK